MGEPNKRVGKQCRERWLNHLQPSINKSAWTPEEDLILLQNHKKFSNQWAKIAKFIPGRTENMVKNRFNTISKKKRDELKTMNKFKKPLDEVIEEIEAEDNYCTENDEIWIDDMINVLSHQIGNLDLNNNDVRYELNMPCLNSPPSIINNNILCNESVLENVLKEREELNRLRLDLQPVSVKDLSKLYFLLLKLSYYHKCSDI